VVKRETPSTPYPICPNNGKKSRRTWTQKKGDTLVAKVESREDRVAKKTQIKEWVIKNLARFRQANRATVGQHVNGPAGTNGTIAYFCRQMRLHDCGPMIHNKPDIEITGEALS